MAAESLLRRCTQRIWPVGAPTTHVPLCALGPVFQAKQVFAPIHEMITISQKTVQYRPTDKLVFVILGILAGAKTMFDLNHTLRVNRPLLRAFGYDRCADQSVIQQTLQAATETNVVQLEAAITRLWEQHNRTVGHLALAQATGTPVTIDLDLSGQPASKHAEHSTKGYFAGEKNRYGRQLARVVAPATQEIVAESLYPGNTPSCAVFKTMVTHMEHRLPLDTPAQRRLLRLRMDAGFGTDANINFALWRGYSLLAKVYSQKRAKKLAKSVRMWEAVPSAADHTPRQAGWVGQPHRYGRTTHQVAVRTPTQQGRYTYHVLVTTDLKADLTTIVIDYDARSGIPESTFCQDHQGLANRKRRKRGFVAQQMLMLLTQLAHNLVCWTKQGLTEAVELSRVSDPVSPGTATSSTDAGLVITTLQERGVKRFVQQIFALSGTVVFRGDKVAHITLNPCYPLIHRIQTAFEAFLQPYKISVSLDER